MHRFRFGFVLAGLAGGVAHAEPAALTRAADPDQKTPPLSYQSPLSGYRSFELGKREDWQALNDRANALGGHMGALQEPEPAPPAGKEPAAPPVRRSQ